MSLFPDVDDQLQHILHQLVDDPRHPSDKNARLPRIEQEVIAIAKRLDQLETNILNAISDLKPPVLVLTPGKPKDKSL